MTIAARQDKPIADTSPPRATRARVVQAVPDGQDPPHPAARPVPGMNGWVYAPGGGVWFSSTAGRWVRILAWCPIVRAAVRYPGQDGRTIGRSFEIELAGQSEVITDHDLVRGPWARFAAAVGAAGRTMTDLLTNIVADQAASLPGGDVIGYPYFSDTGYLVLPPARFLPAGYTRGEGSTLAALTDLLQAIAPHQLAALKISLSAGAPWIKPLQLQPFTINMVGGSTVGKSTDLYADAALWGQAYRKVAQTWGGTWLGNTGSFRDLGVLPVFRDELGAAKMPPGDRAVMFTAIMEGCTRLARTREDRPRPSAAWESICFSTSNISAVPPRVASAGTPKGLLEIHVDSAHPVIPPEAKARIVELTNRPEVAGAWVPFAMALKLADVRAEYDQAAADLGLPDALTGPDWLAWHRIRHMALGLAFARILARLTGVRELADSAEAAAWDVIGHAAEQAAELGADHGTRLLEAVREFTSIRPLAFGISAGQYGTSLDQTGFLSRADDTEVIAVYPLKHHEIAEAAGIEDVGTAQRQLREAGLLLVTRGKGLRRTLRPPGSEKVRDVYAYRLTDPPPPEPPAAERQQPAPEPQTPTLPEPSPASDLSPAAEAAQSHTEPQEQPEEPPPPEAPPEYPDERPARYTARAARPKREPAPRAARLAAFSKAARLRHPDASDRDLEAGFVLFESVTRLRFEDSPGITFMLAFHKLSGHGSVPELERVNTADLLRDLKVSRSWTITSAAAIGPEATWVTGTDVNAQYLAAGNGDLELGSGLPERTAEFRREFLKLPGYALMDPAGLPGPFTAIRPGEWTPMPLVKLAFGWAQDAGRPAPAVSEVIVWHQHRRWLRLTCERFSGARAALLDRTDMPGRIALAVVKITYSTGLGGMIRSEAYNRSAMLRPDWGDMLRALATANMWRGLGKAGQTPFLVMHPDAAYWAMPGEDECPDLIYSAQPGKWKIHRSCPLTPAIRAAVESGQPGKARDLIKDGHNAREARP